MDIRDKHFFSHEEGEPRFGFDTETARIEALWELVVAMKPTAKTDNYLLIADADALLGDFLVYINSD